MSNDDRPSILSEDPDISSWDGWNYLSKDQWDNLDKAGALEMLCALIEHDGLRAFSVYVLSMSHPLFWQIPSSSTGKYHPDHEKQAMKVPGGEAVGLMRHIWNTMAFAMEGMRRYGHDDKRVGSLPTPRARMRDVVVFAVLLHDWARNGDPLSGKWGEYTDKRHGEKAAETISGTLLPMFLEKFPEAPDHDDISAMVKEACQAIDRHYGVWKKESVHPRDEDLSEVDAILQEADFYSSRNFIGEPDLEKMLEVLRASSPAFWRRIE